MPDSCDEIEMGYSPCCAKGVWVHTLKEGTEDFYACPTKDAFDRVKEMKDETGYVVSLECIGYDEAAQTFIKGTITATLTLMVGIMAIYWSSNLDIDSKTWWIKSMQIKVWMQIKTGVTELTYS